MRNGIPVTLLLTLGLALATPGLTQESVNALIDQADELYRKNGPSMAAADAYETVLQNFPSSEHAARARYMIGECLYQIGDLIDAREHFNKVRGTDGSNRVISACAELRLGQCAFELGEFAKASKHFRRVKDDYDNTYLARDARFSLAQTLIALGEWEDFLKIADEVVEKWPGYNDKPELQYAYGVCYYHQGDLERAMSYFQKVESERSRYYNARCLSEEGQYLKAIQQYRQLLTRYPETTLGEDVHFAIAECFLRSGQKGLARKAFQDLLRKYPESRHALAARFKLASILFKEGDYNRTLESLVVLLDDVGEDPLREKILMLQGLSYFELGQENAADHAFSNILQLYPEGRTSSSALFKMVHHYARNENWNQCIGLGHMFNDKYAGDPLEGRVQLLQSLSYLELGETEKGRKILGELLDQHNGDDLAEKALFLMTWSYYLEPDLNRIVTNYRHIAKKLLPTSNVWRARTYYLISESYYSLGLHEDAADLYRQVLNDFPFSDVAPFALQGMTASFSQLGEDEKAALEQERYLLVISNEAGDNPANALAAAGMYFNRKEYKKALALYEEFLTALPDSPERPEALYQSGECLYALQYYEDAVGRWQQVLRDHPDYEGTPEVLFKLADTLFGLQRYNEARSHFQDLATRFPDHDYAEEALFNSANCLYNLKDYDNAVQAFERYSASYPDGLRVTDAQQAIQACYVRGGRDLLDYVDGNPGAVFAADVLWQKGSEAFRARRYEEAAEYLERITLSYPGSEVAPEALFYLAESRFALGDHDTALVGFENFAATYPDLELVPAALLKAGHIYYLQETYAEAAGHFLVLADQYAGSELAPLGLFNAGLCYRKLEQWQSFLSNSKEFLDRYEHHERRLDVLMQTAEVYQNETGQFTEALATYETLLSMTDSPKAQIYYQQGECQVKLGLIDEAKASFRRSAEQPGGLSDDFAVAALARLASLLEEEGKLSEARGVYQSIAGNTDNQDMARLAMERMQSIEEEMAQGGAN